MSDDGALLAFRDYICLKTHFNVPDFDWTKFKNKRLSMESMMKRNDVPYFYRTFGKFPVEDDRHQFLISCFLYDINTWIGDVFNDEYTRFHKARLGRLRRLKSIFVDDMHSLGQFVEESDIGLAELLRSNGGLPLIIASRADTGVTDETLAILNVAFRFCKHKSEDPAWKEQAFVLDKYGPLLCFDKALVKRELDQLVEKTAKTHNTTSTETTTCHLQT